MSEVGDPQTEEDEVEEKYSLSDPSNLLPTDKMFYTPSQMLGTMNSTLAATGGSVEMKRKLPDGSLVPTQEAELRAQDLQAKMRQSAEQTKNLTFDEKILWAQERRQYGNALFAKREYTEAIDVYLTALVAMAGGDSTEDKISESDEKISLPVLLNLAQCSILTGSLSKAIKFCDAAHDLKSGIGRRSSKLFFRRGASKTKIGDYAGAREDLRQALELASNVAEENDVRREFRKLNEKVKEGKANKKKAKKAMTTAVEGGLGLYKDEGSEGKRSNFSSARPPPSSGVTRADLQNRRPGILERLLTCCRKNKQS